MKASEVTEQAPPRVQRVYQLNPGLRYRRNKFDASDCGGEVIYRRPVAVTEAPREPGGAWLSGASGLSNGHIRSSDKTCRVEVWQGAHAMKIAKPGERTYGAAPKRGVVREFSRKSRQRMIGTMRRIRMDKETGLPVFTTNTFPDWVPSPTEVLRMWDVFWKKVERRFPGAAMIWRKELQSRKSGELSAGQWVPHYHALLWNVPQRMEYQEESGEWVTVKRREDGTWVETVYAKDENGAKVVAHVSEIAANAEDRFYEWYSRTWYEVVGSGNFKHYLAGTRVEPLREPNGVRFYVSKYIAKVDEAAVLLSPHCLGRWWGVKGRRFIPWGERVVLECRPDQAVKLMRYARRYVRSVTGRKYYFSRVSMNVFINDSSQWMRMVRDVLAEPETPF